MEEYSNYQLSKTTGLVKSQAEFCRDWFYEAKH
jgi:hypothetical protein